MASMHQALEARRSERLWRERVDAFGSAIEQQKEDTLDITSDMMRQVSMLYVFRVMCVVVHWNMLLVMHAPCVGGHSIVL